MNHRNRTRSLLVLAFIGLGGFVAPAALAEPTPAEITVARRMYAEAVTHEKAEEWPEAEKLLRRVLEIKATPGIYYHLANSLEQQGRLVEAMLNYDRARELIDTGIKADSVLRLLGPKEEELKARVPSLTVVVTDAVGSVEFDRRDVDKSLVGASFPIDPGPHSIVIRTPDGRSFAQSFRAAEGQAVRIEATFTAAPVVTLAPAVAASENAAAPAAPAPRRESTTPWLGYAFAGGALAATGASLYGFLRADTKGAQARTFAAQCQAGNEAACADSNSAGDSRDIGLVIGIASAGAAVGFGALATWQFWPAPTADRTGLSVNFSTSF